MKPIYQPSEAERAVLRKVRTMLGYDPVGMVDLLHILTHPDVIDLTIAYLAEQDGKQ